MAMDDEDFSNLLRSIGSNTSIANVVQSLRNIKQKVRDPVLAAEEPVEIDVSALEIELKNVVQQLHDALATIDRYEARLDKMLPNMMQIVETSVYDFKTATDATHEYTTEWFKEMMLSEDGKVALASKLFTITSRYTSTNLELFKAIASRDTEIMSQIMSPYSN